MALFTVRTSATIVHRRSQFAPSAHAPSTTLASVGRTVSPAKTEKTDPDTVSIEHSGGLKQQCRLLRGGRDRSREGAILLET